MSGAWWKGDGDPATVAWEHIRDLTARARPRMDRNFVNERIYASSVGFGRGFMDQARGGFMSADLNFVRTIVDALVARVGNDRPAVHYPAQGQKWSDRRKAKTFDRLIEGYFESLRIAEMSPMVLRDSLTTSGGIGTINVDGGRLVADRVPCEELLYDEREARYGKPRQMHRTMSVSREVLAEKFSHKRAVVENAPSPQAKPGDYEVGRDTNSMVEVATSWHLPSLAEDGEMKGGRRIISIPTTDGLLDDEPYERDHFPFAILRWSPPRRGFWGSSLVDELAALQYKVNEVARDLMQNIYFTSATKVAIRRGANIEKGTIPGKRPHFIEVDSPADVQWLNPSGFSESQFGFLQWLIQQMFEVSGVSQLMAQGKNPLGAGASGAALNEVYQQDSERFSQLEQAYARWWCDMGVLILEGAKDLYDSGETDAEVKWAKDGAVESVALRDVDLDREKFELNLEPSGFMPSTRSGKIAVLEQLIQNQMIDPKWAGSLVEYPDLKRAQMIQNAPVERALWCIEQVEDVELDEEDEVIEEKSAPLPAPDPHMDLEFTMAVAKAAYDMAVTGKLPEAVIKRHLDFIDSIDAEQQKAAKGAPPAAPPPAMGMPMDPMADPMAAAMPMPPMGAPL